MRKSTVIAHFGSAVAAARALGIPRQTVSAWRESVPARYTYELERITAGTLKAEWPPLDHPYLIVDRLFPHPASGVPVKAAAAHPQEASP
jgi:DNA-binding transcriptional regulator YdaS (Cro superfamily)